VTGWNSRVLVDKLGHVVDLVVDDEVRIVLGVVLRNVLVGELGGHGDGSVACVGRLLVGKN